MPTQGLLGLGALEYSTLLRWLHMRRNRTHLLHVLIAQYAEVYAQAFILVYMYDHIGCM